MADEAVVSFTPYRCDGCGQRLVEFFDWEYELCEACWTARKNRHDATAPHADCEACGTDSKEARGG